MEADRHSPSAGQSPLPSVAPCARAPPTLNASRPASTFRARPPEATRRTKGSTPSRTSRRRIFSWSFAQKAGSVPPHRRESTASRPAIRSRQKWFVASTLEFPPKPVEIAPARENAVACEVTAVAFDPAGAGRGQTFAGPVSGSLAIGKSLERASYYPAPGNELPTAQTHILDGNGAAWAGLGPRRGGSR
jgi:hypothetical protein